MKAAGKTMWLLVAGSGSLSSTTQTHRVAATGYHNRQHLKTVSYFHRGCPSRNPGAYGAFG